MKKIIFLGALILVIASYSVYVSQFEMEILSQSLYKKKEAPFYDYRGVVNVQSNLSLGSSSPNEIIQVAKKLDLDFIFFTDNNLFRRPVELNGYHGSTLVYIAGEYSWLDARLLFLSQETDKYPSSSEVAQIYFTDRLTQKVTEQNNNLIILARPYNPQPTWIGSFPIGVDAIEVLNPKSISHSAWKDSKFPIIWSLLTYPFNSRIALLRIFREMKEETTLWDQVLQSRTLWGVAGADATARAIPLTNYLYRFPSYFRSLGIAQIHLQLSSELTGSYPKDRSKVFSALKNGHFYSSLDLLEDPTGFSCYVNENDVIHPMGSRLKFKRGQKLIVSLPGAPKPFYEIVVIKNGSRIATSNAPLFEYAVDEPGVYRVEVRVSPTFPFPEGKKWINWIYSNPFFID